MRGLALAIGILMLTTVSAISDECLKVASYNKENKVITVLTKGVKEAFAHAQICADYQFIPIKRIQKEISKGNLDAEFPRVMQYIKGMEAHVTYVPTPVLTSTGHIVTLAKSDYKPRNLDDTDGRLIGIMHGYKWHSVIAERLKHHLAARKFPYLVNHLKEGRIDGFLCDSSSLNQLIKNGVLSRDEIYISGAIYSLPVYLVLHKKRAALVKKLDAAIRKVKAAGGFSMD